MGYYNLLEAVQFYYATTVPSFITALLEYDEDNILWIDNINKVIGFKGDKSCLVLPNKIESIQIDNLRPAKGWGGCWMEIRIAGFKNSIRIYQVLDVNQLDKHVDDFSAFFGINVVINDRGYDC